MFGTNRKLYILSAKLLTLEPLINERAAERSVLGSLQRRLKLFSLNKRSQKRFPCTLTCVGSLQAVRKLERGDGVDT